MFKAIKAPGARSLRRVLVAGAVAAAALSGACGDDDTTGPGPAPAEVAGNYELTQVRTLGNLQGGGSGLPVTFTDGRGSSLTFNTGTLTLAADGSYDLEVKATFGSTPVILDDQGSYTRSGGNLTFSSDSDAPRLTTGTVNGSKLTAKSQFGGIPFEIDLRKE